MVNALTKEMYRSNDTNVVLVLSRLLHRIDLCLKLQENEERGGISDEIPK